MEGAVQNKEIFDFLQNPAVFPRQIVPALVYLLDKEIDEQSKMNIFQLLSCGTSIEEVTYPVTTLIEMVDKTEVQLKSNGASLIIGPAFRLAANLLEVGVDVVVNRMRRVLDIKTAKKISKMVNGIPDSDRWLAVRNLMSYLYNFVNKSVSDEEATQVVKIISILFGDIKTDDETLRSAVFCLIRILDAGVLNFDVLSRLNLVTELNIVCYEQDGTGAMSIVLLFKSLCLKMNTPIQIDARTFIGYARSTDNLLFSSFCLQAAADVISSEVVDNEGWKDQLQWMIADLDTCATSMQIPLMSCIAKVFTQLNYNQIYELVNEEFLLKVCQMTHSVTDEFIEFVQMVKIILCAFYSKGTLHRVTTNAEVVSALGDLIDDVTVEELIEGFVG